MLLDDFKAIEILALKSREKPDFESEIRKVQRWFSKTFNTPLKDVEKLDVHYLLLHRYEDFVGNMSEEDYNKYKAQLLWPDKIAEKEEDDDDWVKEELEKEQKKLDESKNKATEPESLPEFDIEF